MKTLFIVIRLAFISSALSHRIRKENIAPHIKTIYESSVRFSDHPDLTFRIQAMEQQSIDPTNTARYLTDVSTNNPVQIAKEFMLNKLGMKESDYQVKDSYKSDHNGINHIYLKQFINGIEVENGDANINIDSLGRIVSFGHSFYLQKTTDVASVSGYESNVPIGPFEAVVALSKYLGLDVEFTQKEVEVENSFFANPLFILSQVPFTVDKKAKIIMNYLQVDNGIGGVELKQVWDIETEMEENWYHSHVDAQTGKVIQLMDWVSDAQPQYNVLPLGKNDPSDGDVEVVVDPSDKIASPLGWHNDGKTEYTTSQGNNVEAQANWGGQNDNSGSFKVDGGSNLNFTFEVDFTKDPKEYVNGSITNLFYWNNVIHDLFYKYGFDEKSGNFQKSNFGKGGLGNDAVIANAQDGSGTNNANFATPPDGQPGKMRMYVWDQTDPKRDGDFVNGIIIHEYAHGISTRLTGGPANSGCLGFGEAGGMGEGWGDFFATILKMKPEYTRKKDFPMGAYALDKSKGIRKYVYSTSMRTNPSTYAFIKKWGYFGVHAKGEVWAVILFEMYWNLVDKHGFSSKWFEPKKITGKTGLMPAGNIIALQLVVDSLKLQPCRPSFVDARDAILQADEVNYGGDNVCEIWKAFAKRGLGFKASAGGNEDFSLPVECQ